MQTPMLECAQLELIAKLGQLNNELADCMATGTKRRRGHSLYVKMEEGCKYAL